MPRVSVIIPTYNCSQFIICALQSAFAQSYNDYEVIVADDGSTDNTCVLIEQFNKPIIYIFQPNRGLSAARNLALSKASGEFVAYLDADDMWYPQKLERQIEFLDAHPECGLVHSDASIIDEEDSVIYQNFNSEKQRFIPQGFCARDLLEYSTIIVPTVVERRCCVAKLGGFDERLRSVEDYLHWIQLTLDGYAIGYIDDALAMYRWRTGSLSKNEIKMAEAMIQVFQILADEGRLGERLGFEVEVSIRQRLVLLKRNLPYLYRLEGRNDMARQRAVELIRSSPRALQPYTELLKSCIPASLANKIRKMIK